MTTTIRSDSLKLNVPLDETNGGTGNNTYSQGDILYASAPNTLSKLPLGSTGQVIASNGTNLSWASVGNPVTSETLNLTTVSQAITPDIDYTFLRPNSSNPQWGTRISGGSSNDIGRGIAIDTSGIYVVGYYSSNPLTVYNADGNPSSLTPMASSGSNDVFIVKYDSSGTALWSARIAGTTFDMNRGDIAVDSTGIYVTGYYDSNPLTVYNADGNASSLTPLANSGTNDAYVVKYDLSGTALWSARIAGIGSESGNGIAVDSSGLYITGTYAASSFIVYNADGNASSLTPMNNLGSIDTFIIKYDTSGTALWSARIAGADTDYGDNIAVDSSGVYIIGDYRSNSLTVYNSDRNASSLTPMTNSGSDDIFIVKYDTSGTALWSARIAGSSSEDEHGIALDSSGVYIVGTYLSNPVTVYNSDGNASSLIPMVGSGSSQGFIVKYDSSGTALWSARMNGWGYNISVDSGGVYITGTYIGSLATFYNADGSPGPTLSRIAGNDVFIAKYDTSSGTVLWVAKIAGPANDIAFGIGVDSGNIYVTGHYSGSSNLIAYDSDENTSSSIPGNGTIQTFIFKYVENGLASLADRSSIGTKVISTLQGGDVNVSVNNLVSNSVSLSNIVFISKGESVKLTWNGTTWVVVANNGAVIS